MASIHSAFAPTAPSQPDIGHAATLEIEVLRDYASFLDLEPVWNRLADQADLDHPFLEHAWLRTWWDCFGCGSRLHILLVNEHRKPIAIAPLIETPIRMFGVRLRRLGFFYNSHVPRSGFIVARRSSDVHAAIWNHLVRDSSWDLLQLCQLPAGSETLDTIAGLAAASRRSVEAWNSSACPYIPIQGSHSDYFERLSNKHRANLRNRAKRLSARAPLEIETIATSEGLEPAMTDGLRLEAAAWKGQAGTAIACNPSLREFYSRLAQRASERGWLRLRFLKSGGERIAVDFSLRYKQRTFLLKHGYDPAFAPFSPSQFLLQSAIEDAFEDRLAEYEILGDNSEWKRAWTLETKKHFWLFVFSNSLNARLAHALKFRLAPRLKRVATRGAA